MAHLNLINSDTPQDKTAPTVMTDWWIQNLRTMNNCCRKLRKHDVQVSGSYITSESGRPLIVLSVEQSVSIIDLISTGNRRWINRCMHGQYMGCDIRWQCGEEVLC